MAQSINTVAVQVESAAAAHVIDVARRLGIKADMEATPSLALGVSGVNLVEMTGAYAGLANGGIGVWPTASRQYTMRMAGPLHPDGSGAGRVLSSACAAEITDMLVEAEPEPAGQPGLVGRSPERPAPARTSATPGSSAGARISSPESGWAMTTMRLNGVTGGGLPAQLWRAFMTDAHAGRPIRPLPSLERSNRPAARVPTSSPPRPKPKLPFWDRLMSVRRLIQSRPRNLVLPEPLQCLVLRGGRVDSDIPQHPIIQPSQLPSLGGAILPRAQSVEHSYEESLCRSDAV